MKNECNNTHAFKLKAQLTKVKTNMCSVNERLIRF